MLACVEECTNNAGVENGSIVENAQGCKRLIEMLLAALQMRFQSEANCTHLEKEDDVAEGIARAFKRISAAAHLASDLGKSAMIGFDSTTRA